MARKYDIKLGQLLIQKQWCTLRQVSDALDRQQELTRRGKREALGRLLVREGILSTDQLMVALDEIGALTLTCEHCQVFYSLAEYDKTRTYDCRSCGKPLVLGDPPSDMSKIIPYHSTRTFAVPVDAFDPDVGDRSGPPVSPSPKGKIAAVQPAVEGDPFIGKVLGGCKILSRIAAGGMGVVYKALQLNLDRIVAVKILSRELASDHVFVRRFIEEARSAAQLNHGNIVHINDVGDVQGVFFFTMEFVDGLNLKTLLDDISTIPVHHAIDIIQQVSRALHHAHQRGVIHRDIKPENIMITGEGVVKLADLGLAKKIDGGPVDGLTQAGSVLGTPYYMAPEQARDFRRADARSDIYSLGVTLYRMLTGTVPFPGRTPIEVMMRVLEGKRPPMRSFRPELPAYIDEITDRMMHPDPTSRFQDVAELLAELGQVRDRLERARDQPQVEELAHG
jgi:hypothetical protein